MRASRLVVGSSLLLVPWSLFADDAATARATELWALVRAAKGGIALDAVQGLSATGAFQRPPTIYFLDGSSVIGHTVHPPLQVPAPPLDQILQGMEWPNIDIQSESSATAERRGVGASVHERLEEYLQSRPERGRHRWIVCNDGSGEIADYLCLEVSGNAVFLGLWHARPLQEVFRPFVLATSRRSFRRRSRAAAG
jgi:hypothetical protein